MEKSSVIELGYESRVAPHLAGLGRPGLQVCIGLAFGAVILVCSLLTALALAEAARRQILQFATTNVEHLGKQMARELSAGMDTFAREVATQATRDSFRNHATPESSLRSALDRFKILHPEFAFIAIIHPVSGDVIASADGIFEDGHLRGRPVFEEGKKGLFLGDVHDAVLLAKLLPPLTNGEPLRFLDVSLPVTDNDGKVISVLAAHVSWDWAHKLRDSVLKPLQNQSGIEILIADTSDKVVLSPGDASLNGTNVTKLLPVRLETAGIARWSDENEYITSFSPTAPSGYFPGFGWKVIARQSTSDALAAYDQMRLWFIVAALVLGIVASAVAWWMTGRILAPFRRLSAAVSRLSADPQAIPEKLDTSIEEIARIQSLLGRLAVEGRAYSDDLVVRDSQFIAFADSLPHLVWQADADGAIEYVNRQWTQVLGPAYQLALGSLKSLLHPDDIAEFENAWRRSRATGADLMTAVRLAAPGSENYRWYKVRGRSVQTKSRPISRWVGTFSDIDDTMRDHERTAEALRDERQAREEAERMTRMKDEFLATLSHELRTPLNAISGWSEVLAHRDDLSPIVSKAADVIRRNVSTQASLIDDLLDMSAVVAGKITLEPISVDAAALITELVQTLQQSAQKKQVTLAIAGISRPAIVQADAQRLNQVLTNLVSNAIKFTDAGGQVIISSHTIDGRLAVEIRDTGCGIAPEFLPHVFDRFRQQDASPTRKRGGMGLGLAIAKSLAELQGGTLGAASEGIRRGSTFTLTLPLITPNAEAALLKTQAQTPSPRPLAGLHILVADDERDARDAAAALLAGLGAEVITAASAAQVLAALTEMRFDALVCDIAMPGMDGHALIAQIRAGSDPSIASLPAVALSAYAMRQDRIAAIKAGFQAHIAKPVSMQRLLAALREALPQLSVRVALKDSEAETS